MSVGLIDKLLGGQEELDKEITGNQEEGEGDESKKVKSNFLELGLIFILAIVPRLLYIFVFSDPNFTGWYTDVFHHWQIAFLSKEIGFHQGFLRLWDFKGMEFFWGLLHPLVLVILFYITGSISILIPRLLSTFGGALSIVLLFLLMRRYFNQATAWATAILASFFPLTLFSNTTGMQEELAMPFLLGGMLLWPSSPVLIGLFFALASMVRAEYWLFALGLAFSTLFFRKHRDKALVLILSYLLFIAIYMKYLANHTGNWIYPIYWNFLASVKGEWFLDLPIVGEKLVAQTISRGIFAFGVLGALVTLIKRSKHMLLYLYGFGNIVFIGFMVGFGSYVKGYIPRFWVDRLYNWPYLFAMMLIVIALFYYLPKLAGKLSTTVYVFSWLLLLTGLVVSQIIWKPINFFMQPVAAIYKSEKHWAAQIAGAYQDGTILLPEDRPYITYFLAHDYKIPGKNMEGQMFDPFFYFKDQENPFSNWGEERKIVLDWLKRDNIKLLVLTTPKSTYQGLIDREPDLFKKLPSEQEILLYEVNIK